MASQGSAGRPEPADYRRRPDQVGYENRMKFHFDNVYTSSPLSFGALRLVQVGDLSCEAGYSTGAHIQVCYEITYIVSGSGQIWSGHRPYPVRRGDIFINAVGDPHLVRSSVHDPMRFFYLGFHFDETSPDFPLFQPVKQFFDTCDSPLLPDQHAMYNAFTEIFNELIEDLPMRDVLIKACLEQILIATYRSYLVGARAGYVAPESQTKGESIVYAAIHYIDTHIEQIKSLKDISAPLGYSYPYLSQVFTRETGRPLKAYFYDKRFERAGVLLQSGCRIGEVAERLGYETAYAFSRAFKHHYGVAPSHYAAQAKTEEPLG